jgi:hypothetical protein
MKISTTLSINQSRKLPFRSAKQWQENYPSDVAIFDLIELKSIKIEKLKFRGEKRKREAKRRKKLELV